MSQVPLLYIWYLKCDTFHLMFVAGEICKEFAKNAGGQPNVETFDLPPASVRTVSGRKIKGSGFVALVTHQLHFNTQAIKKPKKRPNL